MWYEIKVDFNVITSDVISRRDYFATVGKYDALSISHEKTGTSTLFFRSEEQISMEELQKDLGDLEIISFEKNEWF